MAKKAFSSLASPLPSRHSMHATCYTYYAKLSHVLPPGHHPVRLYSVDRADVAPKMEKQSALASVACSSISSAISTLSTHCRAISDGFRKLALSDGTGADDVGAERHGKCNVRVGVGFSLPWWMLRARASWHSWAIITWPQSPSRVGHDFS